MSERERLIEELNLQLRNHLSDYMIEQLATFIIQDRARIVGPFKELLKQCTIAFDEHTCEDQRSWKSKEFLAACLNAKETIKRSGVEL